MRALRRIAIAILIFILSAKSNLFAQAKQIDDSKPFVLGMIEEIRSIQLDEKRVLNIYLPEGYRQEDTTRYPVIYLLDGSAEEDFIHVVGLVQYNSFPWINRIPKSIVVGIANVDRKRDFSFPTTIEKDAKSYPTTGHSDKFIAFLEKELQPFIEKKYKTNSTKTIIGESMGGLLASEILFKKPNLFNKYIIISPSIWWDGGSLLNLNPTILKENFTQNTDIYIAVENDGSDTLTVPTIREPDGRELASKIKSTKSKTVKLYFDYLPQETHATIGHQAVLNAFKVLYKVGERK